MIVHGYVSLPEGRSNMFVIYKYWLMAQKNIISSYNPLHSFLLAMQLYLLHPKYFPTTYHIWLYYLDILYVFTIIVSNKFIIDYHILPYVTTCFTTIYGSTICFTLFYHHLQCFFPLFFPIFTPPKFFVRGLRRGDLRDALGKAALSGA